MTRNKGFHRENKAAWPGRGRWPVWINPLPASLLHQERCTGGTDLNWQPTRTILQPLTKAHPNVNCQTSKCRCLLVNNSFPVPCQTAQKHWGRELISGMWGSGSQKFLCHLLELNCQCIHQRLSWVDPVTRALFSSSDWRDKHYRMSVCWHTNSLQLLLTNTPPQQCFHLLLVGDKSWA